MAGPSGDEEEARRALTTVWRARGLSVPHLEERADGTLMASDRQLTVDSETLAREMDGDGHAADLVVEPLELHGELGRGGMGVVYLADQLAVRREVALKRVTEHGSAGSLRNLLKEAWVGGYLEHPNVVPVHTLASFEGQAAVVMKRIEGTPWRDFVRDPARIPAAERGDPLGWHLHILRSVCDALALAHSRGVLHLDLKPDNVMVGSFGEVYVLDWGLAAGHGDEAPEWLPPADEIRSVAGTPDYMAPELALGAGDQIGPRTDVYLLGAMLHEVVTGRPPHHGGSSFQKLFRAYRSEPHAYGDDVPRELATLLHRALHKDPAARFESVESFRAATDAFLAHREAEALVAQAREQLAALERERAKPEPDELALWRCFGACRFALREATSGWADHPELPTLRARLDEQMARWAMDAGRLDLAESYLGALDAPELREQLDGLRAAAAAQAARVEELEGLARAHDLDAGSRFRRTLGVILGLVFLAVNLSMGWMERASVLELGYEEMLVTGFATACVLGPFGWLKRRELFRNQANTALFTVCMTTFFLVEAMFLIGMHLDIPFRAALSLTPMFYLLAFAAAAVLVSLRFYPSPLVQIPTALLAASFPEYLYEIIGVGGGLSAALVGLVWRVDSSAASGEGESP